MVVLLGSSIGVGRRFQVTTAYRLHGRTAGGFLPLPVDMLQWRPLYQQL